MKTNFREAIIDELIKSDVLSKKKYDNLLKETKKSKKDILELLETGKIVKEEDLARAKGKVLNIPYIDLFGRVVRASALNVVAKELAENYRMVAFKKTGQELKVAMVNPNDYKAIEALEFIARESRLNIKHHIVSPSGLKYILRQYETLSAEVEEAMEGVTSEKYKEALTVREAKIEEMYKTAPVSKMVSVILRHAVEGGASDVHVEPVGDETRVRYRVDGILHTSLVLPRHLHSHIVARIKVLSNLKLDETRVPQDGRFRMTIEGRDIDYRVSTLPLIDSEKVVMRILDTKSNILDLSILGFSGRNLRVMKEYIRKSHGMLLVTGPTGSGKSTTLYALLSILNEEGVNIVTLEDPVEYYLNGINQSQVRPRVGLTFASGLRSILRQDPDIIMVGEIRDNETAELAIHASLTGHVVLSTLHTNDAFGAIPRLIDMKVEPFLIASSVNIILAQRLVRRVCAYCREETEIPTKLAEDVRRELNSINPKIIPPEIDLKKPLKPYRGKGCARCENSGYKGRIAISEVLEVTPKLQEIITSGCRAEAVKEEFNRQGMTNTRQDGIFKALAGLTTLEEVWNQTKE